METKNSFWLIADFPLDFGKVENDPLLKGLGFPKPDTSQCALTFLHAGAAFHRLAVMLDPIQEYARSAQLPASEPSYLHLVERCLNGELPRSIALRFYRASLRVDAHLAESWFNLGRLLHDSNDLQGALVAYGRASALAPHPRAQSHAQLHASAHWYSAIAYEKLGCQDDALTSYRAALAKCDNFGVDHLRFAHFLRRLGLVREATEHYQKLMTYTHRYFTEFVLPSLYIQDPSLHTSSLAPEEVYQTSSGDKVLFWLGDYYRVRQTSIPRDMNASEALLSHLQASSPYSSLFNILRNSLTWFKYRGNLAQVDKACSISEFEPVNRVSVVRN